MAISYDEQNSTTSPPPSSSDNKWGPYSGAGDFTANIVIILISLFCAVVLAIALNAVIRHLLCALRHNRDQDRHLSTDPEKPPDQKPPPPASDSFPTLTFSAGTSKLAGSAPECSVCLAEFADGERVRVLPACNHGFHVECVEKWLASRNSCPTCRTSCLQGTKNNDTNIEVV